MNEVFLNVDGKQKKSTELTYEDLTWLYWNFINTYGYIPTTIEGKAKYNLPQQRIIKKLTSQDGHTYNEFINQFGKVKNVRTEDKSKYDEYVRRYKQISEKIGHGLGIKELTNNIYGLPNTKWLVKNCPDDSVKTFDDFVQWCGFPSNKTTKDKQYVIQSLIDLEKRLGRPITYKDITTENVGFSSVVVNRIWGNLTKCKEEVGLMPSISCKPVPFVVYKEKLDMVLNEISSQTTRNIISWRDIEGGSVKIEHKSLIKAFKREDIDLFAYIKSKGFTMNPSEYSYHYTFDDGERVVSTYEYEFSLFLKEQGYVYKKDYFRDVMYRKLMDVGFKTKMNCDYVFGKKCIEIAGIINNTKGNWDTHAFNAKKQIDYQSHLILKRDLLEANNFEYLFLFPEDFVKDKYKTKFEEFMNSYEQKEALLYA